MNKINILKTLLLMLLAGCANQAAEQRELGRMNRFEDQNIVATEKAYRGTFYREFESNGKLEAVRRAVLQYELDEEILSVDVKNGQRVVKGQTLSTLDGTIQQYSYEKACRMVEKNLLELENSLIGMGYQIKDTLSVPIHLMKVALIRSGYSEALSEKKMAQLNLKKLTVTAPFTGIVAGLKAKPFNRSGQYKEFCTLIDDSSFEVEFPVLESEAVKLTAGMIVAIIPYAFDGDTINGFLSAINPSVSESGMVLATAVVENRTGKLTEGMNAKVIVREAVPNQLIIPKSAVTLRQERKVVFVCKNDTANWRYVNVGEENAFYCTLRGNEIQPGEEVIVEGNFNLSHLAKVVRME